MDSGNSNYCDAQPFLTRTEPVHSPYRVCGNQPGAILSSVHDLSTRPNDAHSTCEENWQLQVLADLFKLTSTQDADELAANLLARFGSLARILHASTSTTKLESASETIGLKLVVAARMLVEAGLRETITGSALSGLDPAMLRYMRSRFTGSSREKLLAIYLDEQNRFVLDEFVSEGGICETKFAVRRILSRAFELGARGIILAHNHPSGVCLPSESDRKLTRWLSENSPAFELILVDHIIMTTKSAFSMRAGGEI